PVPLLDPLEAPPGPPRSMSALEYRRRSESVRYGRSSRGPRRRRLAARHRRPVAARRRRLPPPWRASQRETHKLQSARSSSMSRESGAIPPSCPWLHSPILLGPGRSERSTPLLLAFVSAPRRRSIPQSTIFVGTYTHFCASK